MKAFFAGLFLSAALLMAGAMLMMPDEAIGDLAMKTIIL